MHCHWIWAGIRWASVLSRLIQFVVVYFNSVYHLPLPLLCFNRWQATPINQSAFSRATQLYIHHRIYSSPHVSFCYHFSPVLISSEKFNITVAVVNKVLCCGLTFSLSLSLWKVRLSEELASSTARVSELQLELTSQQQKAAVLQTKLNSALQDSQQHSTHITSLETQLLGEQHCR